MTLFSGDCRESTLCTCLILSPFLKHDEGPACLRVFVCIQGFDCGTLGGERRLFFCWIISFWVWNLMKALKAWALHMSVLTKFVLMSGSDWRAEAKKKKGRRYFFLKSIFSIFSLLHILFFLVLWPHMHFQKYTDCNFHIRIVFPRTPSSPS